MLIQGLAAGGLPIGAIGALASAILAGVVVALSRSRPPVAMIARSGLALANPFILYALLQFGSPSAAILVTVCLLMFAGGFALAESQNDKGVVEFALASAAGVALAGVIPAVHAALVFLSPVLAPWRKSPSQFIGFVIVAFTPAVAAILASIYLHWLFNGSAPVISFGRLFAEPSLDPSNLLALAAAPSILLGAVFPRIAGGSRRGAVFAALMLCALCLLSGGGPGSFMVLGACAFAAEAGWTMRLKSGASLSLFVVDVISAWLIWLQLGGPPSIDALAHELASISAGATLIESQP